MAKASARHILVKTKEEAEKLKRQLAGGADFAALAKKHSLCPSGKRGGDLGEFGPGKMVKAFDNVVFKMPVLTVHGPIKTK
ncbi:MAG: peptidylprolyl isomerase, partial [Gammaproteobacteria bacterium]|nr:peptidylprolyl isomerase [Gammaproteobacteria bacterium]